MWFPTAEGITNLQVHDQSTYKLLTDADMRECLNAECMRLCPRRTRRPRGFISRKSSIVPSTHSTYVETSACTHAACMRVSACNLYHFPSFQSDRCTTSHFPMQGSNLICNLLYGYTLTQPRYYCLLLGHHFQPCH